MKKETKMEINKENALKLWASRFGKKQKVKDFAGREIMRSAYDDRNSKYGWNIDHILPQSQGGKSTESNLICCSILTNDEKQDSFPCFSANDRDFEIRRVQNHYEIFEKNKQQDTDDSVNFFSATEGLAYFKSLKNSNDADLWYSCVSINIKILDKKYINPIYEFVNRLFLNSTDDQAEIVFGDCIRSQQFIKIPNLQKIYILNRNSLSDEQTQNMLDVCILLKTYLEYFVGKYISEFGILLKTNYVDYEFENKDTIFVLEDFKMNNNICQNLFVIDENTKNYTDMKNNTLESFSINFDSHYFICDYINSNVNKELNKK